MGMLERVSTEMFLLHTKIIDAISKVEGIKDLKEEMDAVQDAIARGEILIKHAEKAGMGDEAREFIKSLKLDESRESFLSDKISNLRLKIEEVENDLELVKSDLSKGAINDRLRYLYQNLKELEEECEKEKTKQQGEVNNE